MAIPLNLSEVPNINPYIQYVSGSGQTVFPYPFPITQDSDLIVVVNGVTLNTDSGYTLSGQGNDTGGNLTFTLGQTAGTIVTLYRDVPIERITQIGQNSGFSSTAFNAEFNNLYLIAQQLEAQLGQALTIPNTNNPVPVTTLLPGAYANKYLSFDSYGNPQPAVLTPSGSITQALIAGLLTPQTALEAAAGVTPTNLVYGQGDPSRYGGDQTGVADSSVAWQTALNVSLQGCAVILRAGTQYKITSGATVTGSVSVIGQGRTSVLLSDSTVLTTHGGSNSFFDNFCMQNITAPWIITRNWSAWGSNISGTLQQSSTVLGYQPNVNDVDIWSSLTTAQQNQNIGPVLYFDQAATGITVSRIYGRFVRVEVRDATYSTIQDCDVRGGKGQYAALAFDNWQNGVQRGVGNRMLRNKVGYGSFSGVMFGANDDFQCIDNECYGCGESGTQTLQSFGLEFTASVGGTTSGTILSTPLPTAGQWTAVFWSGETRTITVSGSAVTWTGALNADPSGNNISAYIYAGPAGSGSYQSAVAPHCTRGLIKGNRVYGNYYDGLDCDATYPGTRDIIPTYHQIVGNYSYLNGGDGANSDGRFNSWVANRFYQNYTQGIWNLASFSTFQDNFFQNNNLVNSSSNADLGPGVQGNLFSHNVVYFGGGSGFPIYAPSLAGVVPHVARGNIVVNGTAFFGNSGTILTVLDGNIDSTTGTRTRQSFVLTLANNGGTLQHVIYADQAESGLGLSAKINNASSGGFTNTPTGTDATTAMAAGAKISTTDTNVLILDTAAQDNTIQDMVCSVIADGVATGPVRVGAAFFSIDVNGVTQQRLVLVFQNAGGAFALNTTNIGSGKGITVQFSGYLS